MAITIPNIKEPKTVECTACKGLPPHQMRYCHECKGLGYIEYLPVCPVHYPECPIENEAMTGGWLCNKCGRSGPNCADV